MKKIILFVLLALSFSQTIAQEKKSAENDVELNKVIERINFSLKQAQNELVGIALTEASVTLETISAKSGGGGFKIFVKASKKWSKEASSSVTYSFGPPQKTEEKALVKDQLATIIKNAAEQYKKSIPIETLVKNSFEVEISFSLKNTTEGGIEFKLFGIELEGGVDFEKTVFHKIVLKFE